jgi:alkanesulfonate monooxygenase SsuD/methylene tetrahydromethanopterin reductase-like flavin-dependent oxidoreductase (luciferase family)
MGWWKVEGTQDVIGDGPLDTLTDAMMEVVSQYRAEFNRRPSRAEWEALLTAVLAEEESERRPLDESVVKQVVVELA